MTSPAKVTQSVFSSTLIAVLAFVALIPVARLDFDIHHDGFMLAQAIAASEGRVLHAEVFAQYGPVTPWLHSLFLNLPFSPALSIRIANSFFIAVTVFLLVDVGRVSPRSWQIPPSVAWLSGAAWLGLCDVWFGVRMFPWSSVVASMLVVLAFYATARSVNAFEFGRPSVGIAWSVLAGAVIGLSPFARINVGLAALAVLISLAALFAALGLGSWRTYVSPFALGVAASVSAVLLYLVIQDSLGAFVTQAIVGPLEWSRLAAQDWLPLPNLAAMFLAQIPAMVAFFLMLSTLDSLPWFGTRGRLQRRVVWMLGGAVIAFWESLPIIRMVPQLLSGRPINLDDGRILASEFLMRNLTLFASLAVVTGAVVVAGCVRQARGGFSVALEKYAPQLLLVGLALALLVQIYPTWDSRHIWWGLPLGIVATLSLSNAALQRGRMGWSLQPLLIPIVVVCAAACLSAIAYASYSRSGFERVAVLNGMLSPQDSAAAIREDAELLDRWLVPSGQAVFLVDQGHYSILQGSFRSSDAHFVSWGNSRSLLERLGPRTQIVLEKNTPRANDAEAEIRAMGLHVLGENDRLVIFSSLTFAEANHE